MFAEYFNDVIVDILFFYFHTKYLGSGSTSVYFKGLPLRYPSEKNDINRDEISKEISPVV